MVDHCNWLGRKVLEKSFYDVQRFAEEGGYWGVPCIGHQKLSLARALTHTRGRRARLAWERTFPAGGQAHNWKTLYSRLWETYSNSCVHPFSPEAARSCFQLTHVFNSCYCSELPSNISIAEVQPIAGKLQSALAWSVALIKVDQDDWPRTGENKNSCHWPAKCCFLNWFCIQYIFNSCHFGFRHCTLFVDSIASHISTPL